MAADPNPALRAQLVAARDALAPQIRGLPDIAATSVSPDMIAALNQQLAVRVRRRDLIQAVLDHLDLTVGTLDALGADGWPAPVSFATLHAALFDELQGEQSDLEAAVAVFKEELVVGFNPAVPVVDVTQPVPSQGP
jgi:hypothetical protein